MCCTPTRQKFQPLYGKIKCLAIYFLDFVVNCTSYAISIIVGCYPYNTKQLKVIVIVIWPNLNIELS